MSLSSNPTKREWIRRTPIQFGESVGESVNVVKLDDIDPDEFIRLVRLQANDKCGVDALVETLQTESSHTDQKE